MMNRLAVGLAFSLLLNACSMTAEKPLESYQLAGMQHLQQQKKWSFEGRLAMSDARDSVSASITWRHDQDRDDIELAGPLAQGRLAISLTANKVVIDDGENRQEYHGRADDVVAEQLGVDMPVNALKFWVLGVNDPRQAVVEQQDGFYQGGWLVRFREMQRVDSEVLPKRMTAEKDKTRIKLIVDQWNLS